MIFGGIAAKTDGQQSPHKQLYRKHIHAGLENWMTHNSGAKLFK
jgi:hypothetical protein